MNVWTSSIVPSEITLRFSVTELSRRDQVGLLIDLIRRIGVDEELGQITMKKIDNAIHRYCQGEGKPTPTT